MSKRRPQGQARLESFADSFSYSNTGCGRFVLSLNRSSSHSASQKGGDTPREFPRIFVTVSSRFPFLFASASKLLLWSDSLQNKPPAFLIGLEVGRGEQKESFAYARSNLNWPLSGAKRLACLIEARLRSVCFLSELSFSRGGSKLFLMILKIDLKFYLTKLIYYIIVFLKARHQL